MPFFANASEGRMLTMTLSSGLSLIAMATSTPSGNFLASTGTETLGTDDPTTGAIGIGAESVVVMRDP